MLAHNTNLRPSQNKTGTIHVAASLAILTLSIPQGFGQSLVQTVKGTVMEQETHYPLIGATVILLSDTTKMLGTVTDVDGNFRLEQIPVGRHSVKVSYVGHQDVILNNIIVTSSKEVVLSVQMEESAFGLEEISVTATRDGDVSNDMALVSARSFTIEETERYAGSRGDPARMASNFAGVQGADDSRNDIVIRGNSPQAVLWRMEGINIPNPNHFSIAGTAGGPVSMINNKTLANSDFYTGAFPAEFGNSTAGVFDLKLRNGNNDKHEFSGQFGFLGMEAFAEGPLSRNKKSSYLFSYRYSTLAVFSKLGIDIGTSAVPLYQDIAFKFNFSLKNKGTISFFGLGGDSYVDILVSEQKEPDREIYGQNDRDQHFSSRSGVLGVSYKYPINATNYLSASLATSAEIIKDHDELIYRHLDGNNQYVVDSLLLMLNYRFRQSKVSGSFLYSTKVAKASTLNFGFNSDLYFFQFNDSVRNVDPGSPDYYRWRTRWDSQDQSLLFQPFVQLKYKVSEKTDFIVGLHSQYFSLSNSFILVEPRGGFRWRISDKQSLNLGVGLHSQIQPTYLYFYGQSNDASGNPILQNRGMDFTRSIHYVASYERFLARTIRLKGEIYYQDVFGVPVEKVSSSFSLVNTGAGFSRFFPNALANEGIGKNYGVEGTLEKFFSKGYLFLLTGSLFESKYQGSDKVWRDTDFNGNYIFNALFTKEWSLKGRNSISIGGKVTTAGGRRYGPVDEVASEQEKDVVYVDATRNSLQFDSYFRADLRINYRINRPKVSHEIAVDLVNIFGTKNVLKLTYSPNDLDPAASPVRVEYQLGFLPLFYYRIDF